MMSQITPQLKFLSNVCHRSMVLRTINLLKQDVLLGNLLQDSQKYFHNISVKYAALNESNQASYSKSDLLSSKNKSTDSHPVVQRLLDGLRNQKRASLAESITLVESSSNSKKIQARQLLTHVLQLIKEKKQKKNTDVLSFRIGLSGPPGAGKSTFIECFGKFLTKKGFKVAVLAVDPSSATTGGSILGDKTRMPELTREKNAYIRPSPSRGHLGGVTRSTNEAIVLCEAAGYNVIIVETVGVGQSEYAVADMVDIFSLLIPPGSGDEMQGIKKGIMELSDIIIVNKSDGDLIPASMRVQYEYISALKFMQPRNKHWKPVVRRVSSIKKDGIEELWELMLKFQDIMQGTGDLMSKRELQHKAWMWSHLKDGLISTFLEVHSIQSKIREYELLVMKEILSPGEAADMILNFVKQNIGNLTE